jgi:dihydroorotase
VKAVGAQRLWVSPGKACDLVINGVRVIDPAAGLDGVRTIAIRKGRVSVVDDGAEATPKRTRSIDGSGLVALPGFVDLHAHFRVPGRDDEEDLATATAAAAAGGYVAVFGMANTDPVVDTEPVLRSLIERARAEAVVPCGFFAAVTRGLAGEQLTEMAELADAGAVGFSDDGRSVESALLLRRALQYVKLTDRFIGIHAEETSLCAGGVMHEGAVSARLGLTGMPSVGEALDVGRAVELATYESSRVHICHVSTRDSLAHIATAKAAGVAVTAEVTPHHLCLTDAEVASLDANLKMNPPLRPEADRIALVAALREGLIDCVATDHAPHAAHEKEVPFEAAAFGTTGLETAFAALNTACVARGEVSLSVLAERMSQAPARIAGVAAPSIVDGAVADLCLVDPARRWTVEPAAMQSRSANSAWAGRELTGKVVLTVAAGRLVWDELG